MNTSNRNNRERGQGLVEYALILVLVAVVVIVVVALLGPTIGRVFSNVNEGLAGASGGGGGAAPTPAPSPTPTFTVSEYPKAEFNTNPSAAMWSAMNSACSGKPAGTHLHIYRYQDDSHHGFSTTVIYPYPQTAPWQYWLDYSNWSAVHPVCP